LPFQIKKITITNFGLKSLILEHYRQSAKNAYFFFESHFDFLKMDKKNVQNQLSEITFGKK